MDHFPDASDSYLHGYQPLTIHWALDAHAGLKAVWAFMAGSKLVYPDKWSPALPTLYTSNQFTLGISTSLGRTSTSRVLSAVFGDDNLAGDDQSVLIGEDLPWGLTTHAPGCGHSWRTPTADLWHDFEWPGESTGAAWPEPQGHFTRWGDPALAGLPRPENLSHDPLDRVVPVPLQMAVEEGGVLGWAYPLGMPGATMPKRNG